MSWVQLNGETWPVTTNDGELRVYVLAPDVLCRRISWAITVDHYIISPEPQTAGKPGVERWLNMELGDLTLPVRDWRRLENMEIRADAAWHTGQEYIGPYGHCHRSPSVEVSRTILTPRTDNQPGMGGERTSWLAHDFILRFGSRDNVSFPFELDAWLIPQEEYWRKEPESRKEVERFAQGEPNFRLITRLNMESAQVELTRASAADPVAEARRVLREHVNLDDLLEPRINWALRSEPDDGKIVPMPGWRSTVSFCFRPST